ncbi:hypothetical protein ASE12_02280 [Aeromicrobium sp. Root236]|uniref:hypothetical protein n=1 Tax=Aeromicrobium sp. Root236 TaxID=1736498 RepID=UPI0006F8E2E7|nr:hypothetical protein [Aeromicrobium sp. Root236]KRC63694.1 hypothetical protein ASE12_02280 [Aeromicrobium sp. Root236]
MTGGPEAIPASRRLETWTLLLLTVGAYAGPIAWVAGWILTVRSRRWSVVDKVVAALLPVVMLVGTVPVLFTVDQLTCDSGCNHALSPVMLTPVLLVALLLLGGMLTRLIRAARA